jgi:hypothetical protein
MTLPEFTPELHQLLGEYGSAYCRLRHPSLYKGSVSLILDFEACPPEKGDGFFEVYGAGNRDFVLDRPHERMKAYELLLYILKTHNPEKYRDIHKGTPYFFLAWTAFQSGDFEKGLFYLDAAATEDLRQRGNAFDINAQEQPPAINFLLLKSSENIVGLDMFLTMVMSLRDDIEQFNSEAGRNLSVDVFRDKFIKGSGLFTDGSFRTVLTSLYGFVLGFHLRNSMLDLRSSEGGSLEPFLLHLFKGCLILVCLTNENANI